MYLLIITLHYTTYIIFSSLGKAIWGESIACRTPRTSTSRRRGGDQPPTQPNPPTAQLIYMLCTVRLSLHLHALETFLGLLICGTFNPTRITGIVCNFFYLVSSSMFGFQLQNYFCLKKIL